ncbi:MAG: hypothetical protein GY874_23070 [Desulfobacteraceae bacterium]|nr:hypothetical protein [Desulfobacteraceae bacterium]
MSVAFSETCEREAALYYAGSNQRHNAIHKIFASVEIFFVAASSEAGFEDTAIAFLNERKRHCSEAG